MKNYHYETIKFIIVSEALVHKHVRHLQKLIQLKGLFAAFCKEVLVLDKVVEEGLKEKLGIVDLWNGVHELSDVDVVLYRWDLSLVQQRSDELYYWRVWVLSETQFQFVYHIYQQIIKNLPFGFKLLSLLLWHTYSKMLILPLMSQFDISAIFVSTSFSM